MMKSVETQLAEWQALYEEELGFEFNPEGILIPKNQSGFDRLIVMSQGITAQWACEACESLFPCQKYISRSLNEIIDPVYEVRSAQNGSYAIWVRDNQEADEELKNLSDNDLRQRGINRETLAERLIHEIKFFKETGDHLDKINLTLTGSRGVDGFVPSVGWGGGKVWVYWYDSWYHDDDLRARQVVS